MVQQLTGLVKGYRYNETLPKQFNSSNIAGLAQAAQYAVDNLGVSDTAITTLPARVLMEGRDDAGVNRNSWNLNNKTADKIYDAMISAGFNSTQANYVATVQDKSQVASRLGISFDEAWNGTGRSADTGKTGKNYSDTMASSSASVMADPRNADFIDYINRSAQNQLTSKEKLVQTDPQNVVNKVYGTTNSPTSMVPLDPKADTFSAALFQAASNAGVNMSGPDALTAQLGRDKAIPLEYRDSAVEYAVATAKQVLGIPVNQQDGTANRLATLQKDPVLKTIFDSLAAPIVKQYQGN